MGLHRSELQREVAEPLISIKAINFDAVSSIISKFGARATINSGATGVIINRRVFDACIPVHPSLLFTAGGLHGSQGGQALHEQPSWPNLVSTTTPVLPAGRQADWSRADLVRRVVRALSPSC